MNKEDRYKSLKKFLIPAGIALAIIFIFALFIYITALPLSIHIIWKLYGYITNKIVSISGVSQFLAKGIVIILLIPLIWVIPNIFKRKYRKSASAIGLLYVGVFFLSLFFLSKDIYFRHSGGDYLKEPLKWYALTPKGVRYYDSPGVDTEYGVTLQPVTPENISNLKLWEKGADDFQIVDPSNATWFNPITGNAQLWYYQYPDGTFEFYNKPAHHPITGEPLIAVTKQIYFNWKEKTKTKSVSEGPLAMGPRPEINEKERRLQEFKSIINRVSNIHIGKPNIAMVIESKRSESGISPENSLYNLLKTERVNIIVNLFKEESFKAKGFFREIYDGDTELLRQTDALSKMDNLILGKLNYSYQKGTGIDKDLVSCNINFSYKVINKKGDIIKSDSISVIGPGFSEDAALERGIEILTEKYSDRIFKTVL